MTPGSASSFREAAELPDDDRADAACKHGCAVCEVCAYDRGFAAAIGRAESAEVALARAADCGAACGTVGEQCQACLRRMFHRAVSECTEQREAKEAAYAKLYEARGFILADEERRKLTGDALYAERASEHEFNRANALERACAEKDRRIAAQAEALAELTRQRDELASFHEDEKTWRIGAEQERNDAMQRIRALEDDAETAGVALGAVCVLATLRVNEKYAGGIATLVTELVKPLLCGGRKGTPSGPG